MHVVLRSIKYILYTTVFTTSLDAKKLNAPNKVNQCKNINIDMYVDI